MNPPGRGTNVAHWLFEPVVSLFEEPDDPADPTDPVVLPVEELLLELDELLLELDELLLELDEPPLVVVLDEVLLVPEELDDVPLVVVPEVRPEDPVPPPLLEPDEPVELDEPLLELLLELDEPPLVVVLDEVLLVPEEPDCVPPGGAGTATVGGPPLLGDVLPDPVDVLVVLPVVDVPVEVPAVVVLPVVDVPVEVPVLVVMPVVDVPVEVPAVVVAPDELPLPPPLLLLLLDPPLLEGQGWAEGVVAGSSVDPSDLFISVGHTLGEGVAEADRDLLLGGISAETMKYSGEAPEEES